jgi:hypothetical protein
MIKRKIITPKLPAINVHYCTGISEAYYDVMIKHSVNMSLSLIEEDDYVYGFTITDDINDTIEIYLDDTLPPELYTKTAISEALNAGFSLIRRKLYYSFGTNNVIKLGEDPEMDEVIIELLSQVVTKVLMIKYEKDIK